ncbi:glycosyl transferase [Leifsonia xyli subsp. xyli]|uniref:Glycosyltransferase n=2 Tax=Leifsonia xyli subsp. xyli TaxID=59736 RepID=Q6AEJ6_LEIXX|nr:glycosyltransferase [Leifsonia xyli]AAT89200.1 glycosyltransferase [Leifsonia xyli subsp. xyli str. CTCB07]ODA90855.1 glycosyl transferase [Leifsonia xyli subsp. xyli]
MSDPAIAVVVLTQGTRPVELRRGVESVLAQSGVCTDIVVVGNGWDPATAEPALPAGVKTLALPENLGIPAGRNRGVPLVEGETLFFLDDDAALPEPTFLADGVALIRADPGIGMLQPRLRDPEGKPAPRRWIPRIRKGDAAQSGNVFSVLEAAVLLPRTVFDAAGGWADPFFYAHEGIDLAWKVWDQGKRVWYTGDLVAEHPAVSPTRHSYYYRLNARNRVWLARRNLPAVLVPLYVGSWTGIQLLRWFRKPAVLRAWFGGWAEGWRADPGERKPLSWRTVWRMTRAGRPPIV